jgi:hypothetical protein|tara:strand:+ start:1091 stop:1381 length:291 start_codon:yes stop_codon:yes gene_type:complete
MTESERIAIIANAIAQGDNKLDPSLANYMEDLKAEKLAEDLVIQHGLLEANQNDVEDEFVSLDAVEAEEDENFDNDENLTDMNCVSGSMREIFEDK